MKIKKLPFAFPSGDNPGLILKLYAAIKLKVPRSGDPDIDDAIRESRREEFAIKMLISDRDMYRSLRERAFWAIRSADTLIAEWEKEAGK
jgi:hypothetical protein